MLLVLTFSSLLQISKGLLDKYGPDRVLDTPITEVINPKLITIVHS
jgi:pyruvate/2-oxoglutarate/acetoin dehydrogenase E1 component